MTIQPVDVQANRRAVKWTAKELFGRALWGCAQPLFCLSPRLLWGWRRWLLRCFGAVIGEEVQIYPSVRIAVPWTISIGDHSAVGDRAILYSLGAISIGKRVTVSQNAHLCAGTHDYTDATMPLVKAAITVSDDAWVCADAFVGPGVTIGHLSIVAARAVAVKNVPEQTIVAGNPARTIGPRHPPVRR